MYKNANDYELIYMINENEESYEILYEKYKPLMKYLCKKYLNTAKKCGYEFEDLFQVASLGFMVAVNTYQINQNTLFFTYVKSCIEKRIYNELRDQNTYKKTCLNEAFSFDVAIPGTDLNFFDLISDPHSLDFLDYVENEEKSIKYINFKNSLSFETALVLELKLSGFSPLEMSKILDINLNLILRYIKEINRKIRLNYKIK